MRYGAILLVAILFTWLLAAQLLIDQFETLMLIGGSTTFFWVGGLLDGYLLLQKKSDPLRSDAILQRTFRFAISFATASALASLGIGFWIYPELDNMAVAFFAAYLFLETATQILPYIYIAHARGHKLLALGTFGSIGYVLAVLIPLWQGAGLKGIVISLCIVGAVKFVVLLWEMRSIGNLRDAGMPLGKALLTISLPLILATLLSQSAVYVDGFLVQRFFADDFVDFRYGAKEFPLVLLLANSMSIVRAGEIAAGLRDGNTDEAYQALRKSTSRLIMMLFPICIGLLLLSGPLFDFFFKHRFPQAVPIFDLFLLLAIPRLMFPQSVVRGFQETRMMTVSAAVELVLNVVLSLVLMQYFGLAGIAAATVLAFWAEKGILLYYTQFRLGISWERYADVKLWAGASLVLILVWLVKYVFSVGLFA